MSIPTTTVSSKSSTSSTISSSTPLVLDLPQFRKTTSQKLDYLYEVSFLREGEKIDETNLPRLNPYTAKRLLPNLFAKFLRTYKKKSKENVSISAMSKCPIFATHQDQFITLEIPPEFPQLWRREEYRDIHIGAVRFAISCPERMSQQPMVVKLALLDSRFLKYQFACVATLEATLDAGETVCATVFPNRYACLQYPNLLTLQIQVQIVMGGNQVVSDGIELAILHYQMAYRLQDPCIFKDKIPGYYQKKKDKIPGGFDTPILVADQDKNVTCTRLSLNCTKEELLKVIPDTWITNYENLNEQRKPIESHNCIIERRQDGTV